MDELEEKLRGKLFEATKGTGIIFSGQALGKFIAMGVQIPMARWLGSDGFGYFNLGLSLVSMATVVAAFGTQGSLPRYIAKFQSEEDDRSTVRAIASSVAISLPLSVVLAVILFIFAGRVASSVFQARELTGVIRIFAAGLPLLTLSAQSEGVIRGFKKMKHLVLARDVLSKLGKLIVFVFLFFVGFRTAGVAAVSHLFVTLPVIAIAVYIIYGNKGFGVTGGKILGWDFTRELLFFSFPVLISRAMLKFRKNLDTILVGIFLASASVGQFRVAFTLAAMLLIFMRAMTTMLTPIFSEIDPDAETSVLKKTYRIMTKWLYYLSIPFTVVALMYPGKIIRLFFGQEYLAASLTLRLLVIGNFVLFATGPSSALLISIGRPKINTYSGSIGLVSNIVLDIVFIPFLGISGVALATLLSIILKEIYKWVFLYKELRLHPFTSGQARASAAMATSAAVALTYAKLTAGLPIFVFLVLHSISIFLLGFLAFFLFGGPDRYDLLLWDAFKKKLESIVK